MTSDTTICPNCSQNRPGSWIAVDNVEDPHCLLCGKPILTPHVRQDDEGIKRKVFISKAVQMFKESSMDKQEEAGLCYFFEAIAFNNKKDLLEQFGIELEAWMSIHERLGKTFQTKDLLKHMYTFFGIVLPE